MVASAAYVIKTICKLSLSLSLSLRITGVSIQSYDVKLYGVMMLLTRIYISLCLEKRGWENNLLS